MLHKSALIDNSLLLTFAFCFLCTGFNPAYCTEDDSEAHYIDSISVPGELPKRPSGSRSSSPHNAYPESTVYREEEAKDGAKKEDDSAYKVQKGKQFPTLSGHVSYSVPSGTVIKLKLASVPTAGLAVSRRDIDGRLPPALLHEKITAKTAEDLYVGDNKVLPEGTVFYGEVSRLIPPKRQSRPGSLELSFNSFMTPDGRRFAFKVQADNLRKSTLGTKLHGVGIVASYAAGGAIVGVLVAYQLFGLQSTIAMHGYNIAGGAALGGIAGLTYALLKRGPPAVLEPGDDLNMAIESEMLLPAAAESKPHVVATENPFVWIEILKSKVTKDGLDGHLLNLKARITNNSDERLNSIDLFLQDDNNNRLPVSSGDSFESEQVFEIDPHSVRTVSFSFDVEYPKLKRKLVWLEHQSNKIITMQKLP